MTDLDEQERLAEVRLQAAKKQARRAEIEQVVAKARLDNTLRETRNDLSRRRAAAITGLTPGRVQQIIDSSPREEPVKLIAERDLPVGITLRERREELGLTREDLAQMIGVSPTALARMERSRGDQLEGWAKALGGRIRIVFD